MVQNNNRGGGNNGGGRGQDQQSLSENQATSARDVLRRVLEALNKRGEELAGVLPRDVTLDAFLANVNQALRNNPGLLRCTFDSIVNACVKAAYDGLRIDGKEAAIVPAKENYKEANVWKEREIARYMPMVFGLIKQILQSGAALSVKAVIVYRRELSEISPITGKPRFMLLEGTTPGIHHEPIIEGEKGEMVGCYAVAEIKAGIFKHEWMDKIAIEDVKKEAKTKGVWDRWPTEMWKKSVVRRLRKSLAGTSLIRDMETVDMFPQFDRSTPHPQMVAAPARPVRAALFDQSGSENGTPFDMGSSSEGVEMDRERSEQHEQQRAQRQDPPREQQHQQEQQREPEVQLPEDAKAWARWRDTIETSVKDSANGEALDLIWREAQPILKHATKAIRDSITATVTNRNTDLALEATGEGDGSED